MGLNSCSCFRNFDDLSDETDLNGDKEIEGFNVPNNNYYLFSSTDDSTNLTGAGRMSYLMKVNTYDSGTIKNTAFYSMKTGAAVERIQSVFRGSNFRKKFKKNQNEKLNLENKEKENTTNKEVSTDNNINNKNNNYINNNNINNINNNINNINNNINNNLKNNNKQNEFICE